MVTGASRGLGRAIAEAYAREGAAVVVAARSAGGIERLASRATDGKTGLVVSVLTAPRFVFGVLRAGVRWLLRLPPHAPSVRPRPILEPRAAGR